MIYNSVLEIVGSTPMIRLNNLPEKDSAEILVKFEGVNIGGSIKTRTALNMIEQAEKAGEISPEKTIIVEPTSGNQGIGLALVGAVKGYRTIIIMPDSVSEERAKLVRHYGAKVKLIHDAGDIGKAINECLQLALKMRDENPDVFVPEQFDNPNNTLAHRYGTAQEILEQVDGPIHGFCSGIGTGGTLTGVGEVLKEKNPDMKIWAVEPEKAAILAGGTIGTHMQMGIGDGIIPSILNREIYDEICIISDDEAIRISKRLASEEGLLCGISSGTNVAAAIKLAKKLGAGKTVVTILPDTGERYFSTPLFSELAGCDNNNPGFKYSRRAHYNVITNALVYTISFLQTYTSPPWRSMIRLVIASPSPEPRPGVRDVFSVTNGSKTSIPSGIGSPLSAIRMTAFLPSL